MSATAGQVTLLLMELRHGNKDAANQLLPLIYSELRKIAGNYMQRERPGHTLQATALVNEAYMRLAGGEPVPWASRAHFLGVAAHAMREVLLDYARRHVAEKRGGKDARRVDLDFELRDSPSNIENVIIVDEALRRLELLDPRQCRLIELRYFSGLTIEEAAEVMSVSPRTIKREWRSAKAWLHRELGDLETK